MHIRRRTCSSIENFNLELARFISKISCLYQVLIYLRLLKTTNITVMITKIKDLGLGDFLYAHRPIFSN